MTFVRFVLCLLIATLSIGVSIGQNDRPNIVFLLADDLGYGDLACYGRPDIRTPNLDRLAQDGVRFTQHYANGPECTPTRTAFLTGRYQQRVGGLECAIGLGNVGRYDDAGRLAKAGELGLPAEVPTIGQILKRAGYATALSGKWHLGYEAKFAPSKHGFDHAFYCIGGAMDYFHYIDKVAGYNLFENGDPINRDGYFTDLLTDEAIRFVEQRDRGKPFFLYVPYTCPHTPYQGPTDFQSDPLPLDSPLWHAGRAPKQTYIAMIEHMDRRIGDLLQTLDRNDLTENTMVIFASDNGGNGSARNTPCSGTKGQTFEGGIRVPAMIRWPGVVPAGTECDQPCMTFDLSASIVNTALEQTSKTSSEHPQVGGIDFDGIDILQHVINEKPTFDRTLYWRKPRGETIWKAVRDGSLKWVCEVEGDVTREFLFDLSNDIAEKSDLKQSRPDDFYRLKALYGEWEKDVRRGRRGTAR